MTYAYSFAGHFIISFFPFVFSPHPVTEPIANTEYTKCVYTIMSLLRAIGRLARYTTKYMQIGLIRLYLDITSPNITKATMTNSIYRQMVSTVTTRTFFC